MGSEKIESRAEVPEGIRPVAEKDVEEADGGKRKRGIAVIAFAAVVLMAAVGIGVAVAAGQPAPVQTDAPVASSKAPSPSPEQKAEKSAVMLTVKAEGAEAGATKAKVVTTGESGEIVVAETEVEANKASKIGTLPKGDYELHVTAAPVCGDGSSYKLPEKPVKFSVDGEGGDVKLEVKLEKIAADKMTKEQLEASAAALEEAGNSAAAQDVKAKSESAVSQPGSDSEIKRDPTPTPAPDNGNGSGNSGGNSGSGSGDNGGSSSGNGGGQTPPPAAHEHSWTPVTAQQWVPNIVTVVDQEAWDEPVYETVEREICNTCGADVTGFANQHLLDSGRGGCQSWRSVSTQIQTGTIHHDAVTHTEDKGHNETVVTGYTCSCGATK